MLELFFKWLYDSISAQKLISLNLYLKNIFLFYLTKIFDTPDYPWLNIYCNVECTHFLSWYEISAKLINKRHNRKKKSSQVGIGLLFLYACARNLQLSFINSLICHSFFFISLSKINFSFKFFNNVKNWTQLKI